MGNKRRRTPSSKPKTRKKKKEVKEEVDIKSEGQKSVGKVISWYHYYLKLMLVIIYRTLFPVFTVFFLDILRPKKVICCSFFTRVRLNNLLQCFFSTSNF